MKSYLVDFENVKSKGLVGIENLTKDDHVVIFYSENSDTISFEMHCSVMRAQASVEYMKVNVGGKNALDFQLSTLLGYMVAQNRNTHIFIISNDKGFDKLHDFWENTFSDAPDCVVFRTHNIAAAVNYAKNRRPADTENPDEPADAFTDTVSEPIAETAENRSMSAEIVVVPEDDGSAAAKITAENDEPKFIVPEPMLEKFRSDPYGEKSRKAARAEQEKKKEEAPKKRAGRKSERTPAVSKNVIVVTNDSAPPVHEPRFPQYRAPGEKAAGTEYYREMEMASMEPAFRRFLESPEAQDKHKLLKQYLPDENDETVSRIRDAILESACRPELHNLLMKQFENETATKYYNSVKPHYDFFKRVLPDQDTAAENNSDKQEQTAENPAEPEKPETEKSEQKKKSSAREKKSGAAKPTPRKVDAEMKKKLHSLLDDIATPDEFSGIVAQINQSATSQQLYINMMQRFKKERGCELYKAIKGEYRRFISAARPSAETEQTNEYTAEPSETAYDIAEPKKVDTAMKRKLHSLLDDAATPDEFSGVVAQINQSADLSQLWANMTQRFGNERGDELYTIIKEDFSRFSGEPSAAKSEPDENTAKTEKSASGISSEEAEKMLRSLLDGKADEDELATALEVVKKAASRHELYLGMIKKFRKKRGLVIYNEIKNEYEKLLSEKADNA